MEIDDQFAETDAMILEPVALCTPVDKNGEGILQPAGHLTCYRINTMITVDFNGKLDSPIPRLRVAYGEIINDDRNVAFMAGQFFTTMVDLKAQPETLDFAGPTGLFARRQPVAKFSKLYGREVLTEMAIETPEDSIFQDAEPLTGMPAFVYASIGCPRAIAFET